jgi:hypothetical protein
MCAGRATAHEKRMDNHDPAQPPRTGAEKMKKIGDKAYNSIRVAHNVRLIHVDHEVMQGFTKQQKKSTKFCVTTLN